MLKLRKIRDGPSRISLRSNPSYDAGHAAYLQNSPITPTYPLCSVPPPLRWPPTRAMGMAVFRRCAKAKPTPVWPSKKPVRTCQVVLPGNDGIGALASETAAAIPRRASVRLLLIWLCRPEMLALREATVFCRFAIVDGPKTEVARCPAASVVTKLVGPDCCARLAAEVSPGNA